MKENCSMLKRRLAPTAVVVLAALVLLAVLPMASASAASPWWQVMTGSRPSHLWEPTDHIQTIKTEVGTIFSFEGVAQRLEVEGKALGCLGTADPGGSFFCTTFVGTPPISNAAELEAALEAAYGTDQVEVTGGPVGGDPFHIVVPGREEPAITLTPAFQGALGAAKATVISAGGSGRLAISVTNLGDEAVNASKKALLIADRLPEGVEATGVSAVGGAQGKAGTIECALEASSQVLCEFEGTLGPYDSIDIEISVRLIGSPPIAGDPGEITVSGANSPFTAVSQPITLSPEPTPFGIERFDARSEQEGGAEVVQAGAHPFQLTTAVQFNSGRRTGPTVEQPALPRNVRVVLPAGLAGNTNALRQCDLDVFYDVTEQLVNRCPDDTAVGAASVTFTGLLGFQHVAVPVFSLAPAKGEPARFGFMVGGNPVLIDTELDPEYGYRLVAVVRNTTQVIQALSTTLTMWGTPGDPRHDNARGWACVYQLADVGPCERPQNLPEIPLLRQPVSCSSGFNFDLEVEPWNTALGTLIKSLSTVGANLQGCNRVPFSPSVASSPTSEAAEAASGFDFRLDFPNSGLLGSEAIAEGQPKKVEVTLPKGMTVNPSNGEGLAGCTPAQYRRESASSRPGEGCPDAAKIGTVDISTPLLKEEGHGGLFIASPYDNPSGSLLALYLVARIPERGIVVKLAGKVDANPDTGQLTTTFDDLPQLPFSTFKLRFREGGRAPLVTPPVCGTYDVVSRFTPWSAADPDQPAPGEVVTRVTSFAIRQGLDGGACPSDGLRPFRPDLVAGTLSNAAGTFSPFTVQLTRKDGEQEFTHFSIKLPPGVSGKLTRIPFCPDNGIDVAQTRKGPHGGEEELRDPSCPAASEIGHTSVGAGVGSLLTYVPGKVYLAGPYHGSAFSIVSITAAKVGPFDLGTVVVREALKINPDTAEVFVDATGSDPIPHIVKGLPVHAREIWVDVDRPDFVLNPTGCKRTSTSSTVVGSGLDFGFHGDDQPVTVTSPFQAADCSGLGFRPRLALRLIGGTKRSANPALKAVVKARKGDANIGKAQVTLPHSEFLDQSHIRTVCTRTQFAAGLRPGEGCPAASIYGHARAITPLLDDPLQGPVFLRSSSHALPDLVAALHSDKIDINVVGRIDSSRGGIRTSFETVPDAPITRFTLTMQGGHKGLLINSTDICHQKARALAVFAGHNGRERTSRPLLKSLSCGKRARDR
jgi:hypothetical protein